MSPAERRQLAHDLLLAAHHFPGLAPLLERAAHAIDPPAQRKDTPG